MTGAVFYHAECTSPFGFTMPHLRNAANLLAPGTERLLGYHLLLGALALMHRKPFQVWTIDQLAAEAGTSRSVLAERFALYLGEPPLTYLARWRLQLAARLLQTTQQTVLQVAGEVGYDSEAAFNRAFKREFGVPPGRYRRNYAPSDRAVAARNERAALASEGV